MMGRMSISVKTMDKNVGLISNCENIKDKRYDRVKSKPIDMYTSSSSTSSSSSSANQMLYYSSESSNDSPMPKRQKNFNYQSIIDSSQHQNNYEIEENQQNQLLINPPRQRQSANARERDRTHSVNSAFTSLRTLIPTEPADRKLSKIETLRLASSYISHLGTVLMAGSDQPCLRHHNHYPSDLNNSASKPVCTFCLSSVKKTLPNQMVRSVTFT
ncbi:hypothetical protein CHUAL_010557 [Chamberlinius hualienensis]